VGLLLAVTVALAAACGGSSSNKTIKNAGDIAKNSPSASAAANATPTPAPSAVTEFGVPPVLGGNVTKVRPEWGKSVSQASTKTPNKATPNGVCADISYSAPATNALWFRMAVDGTEVTQKLIVTQHVVGPTATTAETGTICYAPAEGLTPGMHSAAVSVQNPQDPQAAIVQTVSWKFRVTP
jgi:hypothetical protein